MKYGKSAMLEQNSAKTKCGLSPCLSPTPF